MERRYQLHAGAGRGQGGQRAPAADRGEAAEGFLNQLTRPPTMVAATRPSSTTVKSHSLPSRNAPRSRSMPTAYAALDVYERSADARDTARSGCHFVRRRQTVAASMPSKG